MARVQIVYPSTLPCPVDTSLQSAERRSLSEIQEGERQSRPFSRDRLAAEPVEFIFTHEELAIFTPWVKVDLRNAAAWFAADWPLPQGGTGVRRFVGTPSYPVYLHGIGWRVTAMCQLRGRGELPLGPDPFLVSAFDFETGLVDLVRPERAISGAAIPNGAQFVNGAFSAGLTASNYFWLPTSADFGFGTEDFGIELWQYYPNPPGGQAIDLFALNGVFNLFDNGIPQWQNEPLSATVKSLSGGATPANTWQHLFVGRQAGVAFFARGGLMETPSLPTAASLYDVGSTGYLVFGNRNPSGTQVFSGTWSVDRIRVYKGLCPYTANFTPSVGLYPN